MITAAVFDTKPYGREALEQASANHGIDWHFLEFRPTEDIAHAAKNARTVCALVNDQLNRRCLEALSRQAVELVALRSTGFSNVDVGSAKELKFTVTRVPVYSPHCRSGTCRGAAAHLEPQDPSSVQPRAQAELFA